MNSYVHFNGALMPASEASLALNDLAILRGYGIFDYFLFQRRTPFFLPDYLERFFRSAQWMNLDPPCSLEELAVNVMEVIQANHQDEGAIRLLMTGGYSSDGYTPARPNLAILQHPFPSPPERHYTQGVKVMLDNYVRDLPEAKSINYTRGIFLRPRLESEGALEPLYHDNGVITEAVRSNFFAIFGKRLVTPKEDILMGITRRKLIDIARNYYEVEERSLSVEEMLTADEALLTGSSKGIMPVVQVDEHLIGTGRPGPVTRHLMEAFETFRQEYLSNPMVRG